MGLEQREGGNYITILNGKFCQRVSAETEGAIARVNKLGKQVHEKFYDSFVGKLVNIRTQDGTYGKSWIFDFQDKGEIYHLQLSYSNSYATAFLKMLPNINLEHEMKVSPAQKEVDGKMKSSLFINQDGKTLKHAYTRENPNGLPDMEKIIIKGQETWDDTKRLVFLYDMVQKNILPKLPKTSSVASVAETKADKDFEELAVTSKPAPAAGIDPSQIDF